MSEVYPGARVEMVYQDRSGLVWFGSHKGLFRYDGQEFLLMQKNDSTSQRVRAIFQDKKMQRWVGYHDGTIYKLQAKGLVQWMPDEGTPRVPITGIAEDGEGQLWFSTYGEGAYCFDGVRLYNFNTDDGLLGNDVYVMAKGPDGRIWLGTDGGISICSFAKGKKIVENLTREDGLPDEIVHELLPDQQGNIWVGNYDKGICRYLPKERRFDFPLKDWSGGIVNHLALFEQKELWIGTDGQGIWRYNLQDGSLRPATDFEKSKVYDLMKDTEGNVWAVTNTGGVRLANRQFEYLPTAFKNIQAVVASRDGCLWGGTPDGLFCQKSNGEVQPWLQDWELNVISLHADQFENIWIGTFDKGVFCLDPKTGRLRQLTEKDGITNNSILSIDGTNGYIWLATLSGVTEVDNSLGRIFTALPPIRRFGKQDGLAANFIYKVFVDRRKRTWFCTDGQGISLLENGRIKNYQSYTAVDATTGKEVEWQLKAVYSMAEDQHGHIWISTATEGIFEFDGKSFKRLAVKEGIRDLAITSLVSDANGQLVVVHPSGIDLLTPETHHLIYYDEEIGLKDIDPTLNASCSDQFGNVWIGVKNGFFKYTPLNEPLEIHPKTHLYNVMVSYQSVDFQKVGSFSHGQNNFYFEFFGLWYTDPASVRYRYRLMGYDTNWVSTKDRQAAFASLPPGKYRFEVTSTENDAWSDEPVVSYEFNISPPFWRRWWFVLGCFAMVGAAFYGYQKTREERLKRVALLEKEKVESELAALKAQINPHFLFNSFNTLIAVIEEDPKAAVEYVENMSDFYRTMLQLRDKPLISLEQEVDLAENFGYLLRRRYGDAFILEVNPNCNRDVNVVPLTLQILVENAVKHNVIAKSKPLKVQVSMGEDGNLVVKNNLQPKLQPAQGTGFGLDSLCRRYELLTGKQVIIEKTETEFKVSVPTIGF
jgi:ligand-binding sensor domain-containing protein